MRTLLFVALVSVSAQAQVARDRVEKAQDRKALRQDARERRDDRRDLLAGKVLLTEFDLARSKNDVPALLALDKRVAEALEREQREGRWELAKDKQEVRQDRRELGSDRREVKKDVVTGAPPAVVADDLRDKRDDRRDLADDKRDARVESRQGLRIAAMRTEWAALTGKHAPAALDLKRALLVEYVGFSAGELVQDRKETREDVRELREDRRELREDVRQK